MQGEKIGEASGKVTSRRVLANPGGGPKMETSFEASARLLGVEATERHVLVSCPARRQLVRRGARHHHGKGRRTGNVGRPGCGHHQEGWGRELPWCRVLPDFGGPMGAA